MASTSPNKSSKSPKFGGSLVALPLFPSVSPSPFFSPTPLSPRRLPLRCPPFLASWDKNKIISFARSFHSHPEISSIHPPHPLSFTHFFRLGLGHGHSPPQQSFKENALFSSRLHQALTLQVFSFSFLFVET